MSCVGFLIVPENSATFLLHRKDVIFRAFWPMKLIGMMLRLKTLVSIFIVDQVEIHAEEI